MASWKFKHLSELERIVADALLKHVFPNAKKVEFDVPLVSEKIKYIEDRGPFYEMWKYLTAKKIDMVVHLETSIYIVEIKEKLSASAYGQLKLYEYLYKLQYKPKLPVKLLHAAYYNDPDVEAFLKSMNIEIFYLKRIV